MWADYKSARAGVRHCLAGELLKVAQNIESFCKIQFCPRFGLLCIINANTQCGRITNPPEQVNSFILFWVEIKNLYLPLYKVFRPYNKEGMLF